MRGWSGCTVWFASRDNDGTGTSFINRQSCTCSLSNGLVCIATHSERPWRLPHDDARSLHVSRI